MLPGSGDSVRLLQAFSGMPAGSEGVFVGWFHRDDDVHAIVRFWDGGPLRVPVALLVALTRREERAQ